MLDAPTAKDAAEALRFAGRPVDELTRLLLCPLQGPEQACVLPIGLDRALRTLGRLRPSGRSFRRLADKLKELVSYCRHEVAREYTSCVVGFASTAATLHFNHRDLFPSVIDPIIGIMKYDSLPSPPAGTDDAFVQELGRIVAPVCHLRSHCPPPSDCESLSLCRVYRTTLAAGI